VKEHTTANHVRGGAGAPIAAPAAAPAPAAGSSLTGALAAGTSDDAYSGGRLTFNGGLFLGGATGVQASPAISDPMVSLDDPTICQDDFFFSDTFRLKQQGQEGFYDALERLPTERASGYAGAIIPAPPAPAPSPPSPYDLGSDEDEEPPGRCPNCRSYGWIRNFCDSCEDSGCIYEHIDANQEDDVSKPEVFTKARDNNDEDTGEPSPEPVIDWTTGRCDNCDEGGSGA
jgi:hypothetical protein